MNEREFIDIVEGVVDGMRIDEVELADVARNVRLVLGEDSPVAWNFEVAVEHIGDFATKLGRAAGARLRTKKEESGK